MRKLLVLCLALLVGSGLLFSPTAAAQTDTEPVVHAVLFFSPTCPHCHEVINNLIIPMTEQYGDRLQILGVNVSEEAGQALYQLAVEHYDIPPNRFGVPTMVVNDIVLVGSGEIPDQFPGIVEAGLAANGIDWPGIPGLAEAIAPPAPAAPEPASEPAAESEPAATAAPLADAPAEAPVANEAAPAETDASLQVITEDNAPVAATEAAPPPDPIGISLAALVLGAMLVALAFTGWVLLQHSGHLFQLSRYAGPLAQSWLIPALSLVGLAVAGYLAYVEITHTEAVCGPVGNCNVVQSSEYATIFGIPVAVLGIANYLAIMALWGGHRASQGSAADTFLLGLLGLGFVGTLFSVYLTLLEIFVIHAVCAWCISSAIITTAIMLIVTFSLPMVPSRRPATA